jgi:hypothetical protein
MMACAVAPPPCRMQMLHAVMSPSALCTTKRSSNDLTSRRLILHPNVIDVTLLYGRSSMPWTAAAFQQAAGL